LKPVTNALSNLVYFAGGALWMAIMMKAALTIPVIGFAIAIPAGLVIYAVRNSMFLSNFKGNDDLILD
jgi:hypothetical protein